MIVYIRFYADGKMVKSYFISELQRKKCRPEALLPLEGDREGG